MMESNGKSTSERVASFDGRIEADPAILSQIYDLLEEKLGRYDEIKRPGIAIKKDANKTIIFQARHACGYVIHFYYKDKGYYLFQVRDKEMRSLLENVCVDLHQFVKDKNLIEYVRRTILNQTNEDFLSRNNLASEPIIADVNEEVPTRTEKEKMGSGLEELRREMREVRDREGLYISKIREDHFKSAGAELRINKEGFERELFDKLVIGWGATFSKKNGQFTVVYKNDDAYSLTIWNTGKLRLRKKPEWDWKYFLRRFRLVVPFLETHEFYYLLSLFEEEDKEKFRYEHLANPCGPLSVVDAKYKGARVKVSDMMANGFLADVIVTIDYSKGKTKPHIEIQGAARQSELLRDTIEDDVKVCNFLAELDGKVEVIEDFTIINAKSREVDSKKIEQIENRMATRQDLLSEVSEIIVKFEKWFFGLDIKLDLEENSYKKNVERVTTRIQTLKKFIRDKFDDMALKHNRDLILIYDSLHTSGEVMQILSDEGEEQTDKILSKFDDLEEQQIGFYNKSQRDVRELLFNFKNNLEKGILKQYVQNFYLLVRKLNLLPENVVKAFKTTSSRPKQILLNNFNKMNEGYKNERY